MPHDTSNLLPIIERSLPTGSYTLLKAVAEKASDIGIAVYLVGGPVRDILLGLPVEDLDIVVEGEARRLGMALIESFGGSLVVHERFSTATVKLDNHRLDLATARSETYVRPGALPRIIPSDVADDSSRRDFTINSMAIALTGPSAGRLVDNHGGYKDLNNGQLRILHAQSFVDDPTRILRAIRYEQRLRSALEKSTEAHLLEAVDGGALGSVSGDRVRREIDLILKEKSPLLSLLRAGELGVLRAIYIPLGDGTDTGSIPTEQGSKTPLLYLGAMSYRLTSEQGESLISRLRMSSKWANIVRETTILKDQISKTPAVVNCPGQLCQVLDGISTIAITVNSLLSPSQSVRTILEIYLSRLRYIKPALRGNALIELGVPVGPIVGEVVRGLRVARIEGRVNSRAEEVRWVKDYLEDVISR